MEPDCSHRVGFKIWHSGCMMNTLRFTHHTCNRMEAINVRERLDSGECKLVEPKGNLMYGSHWSWCTRKKAKLKVCSVLKLFSVRLLKSDAMRTSKSVLQPHTDRVLISFNNYGETDTVRLQTFLWLPPGWVLCESDRILSGSDSKLCSVSGWTRLQHKFIWLRSGLDSEYYGMCRVELDSLDGQIHPFSEGWSLTQGHIRIKPREVWHFGVVW